MNSDKNVFIFIGCIVLMVLFWAVAMISAYEYKNNFKGSVECKVIKNG